MFTSIFRNCIKAGAPLFLRKGGTLLKTLDQWPNLKNLSGGLNMVGSTYNCITCLKI